MKKEIFEAQHLVEAKEEAFKKMNMKEEDLIIRICDKSEKENPDMCVIEVSWKDVSSIGDGSSDAPVLEASGLGVTLENGCKACKKVANKIVPPCYEDGCIEWLKEL